MKITGGAPTTRKQRFYGTAKAGRQLRVSAGQQRSRGRAVGHHCEPGVRILMVKKPFTHENQPAQIVDYECGVCRRVHFGKSYWRFQARGSARGECRSLNSDAADGVYATFWHQGFFIVRQAPKLLALSAMCTHRRCKLDVEPDGSFSFPCHGSTFDNNGRVTHGPARRDLPVLATSFNKCGCLLVSVPAF